MHVFMKNVIISVHCKTQSITKRIVYRYLVTNDGYKKSFQYRILNYFDDLYKESIVLQKYEVSSQIREDILECNGTRQKLNFIHQLIHNLSIGAEIQTEKCIKDLDKLCYTIVSSISYSEILNLLTLFLKVIPNGLTKTKFYQKSLSFLSKGVECGLLSNYEILQLLFFISLKKEGGSNYLKYLKSYLTNLEDMPLLEKCIVATCFYKTSLKASDSQLKIFEKTIEEKVQTLILDPPLLVSLCKIVRISGPSDGLNLNKLSNAIINLKEPLEFTSMVHVLSLYAQALLFKPKAIDRLVTDGIEQIRYDSLKPILRLKDFDRFLWSISYLGLTFAQKKKIILKAYLELRLNEYKKIENLGIFVNSILCLHMLKCWNIEIINYCFNKHIFEPIFFEKYHWKVRSRLQLLVNQINLEINIPIPQTLKRQIPIEFTPSKHVQLVADIGKGLVSKGVFKSAILECPVRNLQIPGVTLTTEKNNYHIDVLDNAVCLRNTQIPHGLMDLKLRLLSRLKYQPVLISGNFFDTHYMQKYNAIEEHIMKSVNN